MSIGKTIMKRALLVAVAAAGLSGCVAYPAGGYYAEPGYDAAPVSGEVVIDGGGGGHYGGGGRHWR